MSPRQRYLDIADQVRLPIDMLSEAWAVLGSRGSGKTYAAKRIVEEALKIKYQIVIFDPMHAWWGLRSSADGNEEGFPITIFGGERGDLPLEAEAGRFFADLVAGDGISCIFDIKLWSKAKRRLFVADFAERLLKVNKYPICVVFEEMSRFAPQTSAKQKGDERMLGAVVELATEGRGSGIGVGGVSQRSARVHKDFLEETDSLLMMRTGGVNDRKTMRSWITTHELDDEAYVSDVLRHLPKLQTGTGYLWSPVRLDEPVYIEVNPASTFDSSATPKAGQRRRRPKTVAEIDKEKIATQMQEFIARADANDPKKLHKRIAELERELKKRPTEKQEPEKIYVLDPKLVSKLDSVLRTFQAAGGQLTSIAADLMTNLQVAKANVVELNTRTGASQSPPVKRADAAPASRGRPAPVRSISEGDVKLGASARRLMDTLAEHPNGLPRSQLGGLAKVSSRKSTMSNALTEVRNAGFVYEERDLFFPTEVGLAYAGGPRQQARTPEEIQDQWMSKIPASSRRILTKLLESYPNGYDRQTLGQLADVDPEKSTMSNALTALRVNNLVREEGGTFYAADFLMGVSA